LPAFALGLAQGAGYLETDARLTRDGEVVLFHDADLERTTDGSGPVSAFRQRELAELDAGYQFTRDGGRSHPFRGRGVRVPRLRDLLDAQPRARVNIEIKGDDPAAVDAVIAVVRAAGAEARVLLAAADGDLLERVVARTAGTAIGSAISDVVELIRATLEGRLESFAPRGAALQIPPRFLDRPLVTPELIAAAHQVGLEVHVWTIDDPQQAADLLALGVDGIMTDYPARLAPLFR